MSFFTAANTGPTFVGPGMYTTFLATAAETDGDYFVTEGLVPPDGGPPLHIHQKQVETFYVVEQTPDRSAPPASLGEAFIQRSLAATERYDVEVLPPPEG